MLASTNNQDNKLKGSVLVFKLPDDVSATSCSGWFAAGSNLFSLSIGPSIASRWNSRGWMSLAGKSNNACRVFDSEAPAVEW